jgi:hypothetical protein
MCYLQVIMKKESLYDARRGKDGVVEMHEVKGGIWIACCLRNLGGPYVCV